MKIILIDDGYKTYHAIKYFPWTGETCETPWGIAAYTGTAERNIKPSTGRIGGWFGTPNGRTWSQIFPIEISQHKNPDYDINAQDVYAVNEKFGGGYVSYGRHDFGPYRPCPFGDLLERRISNCEADFTGCLPDSVSKKIVVDGTVFCFDLIVGWADIFSGGKFTYKKTESEIGRRDELEIPGCILFKFGWNYKNRRNSIFEIRREQIFLNENLFAQRIIPKRCVEEKINYEICENCETEFESHGNKICKICELIGRDPDGNKTIWSVGGER